MTGKHIASADDAEFRRAFEACRFPPAAFDHRAPVRLAYVYLVDHSVDEAADAFIDANPMLLDSRIMLTHYSAEQLFSPEARARFVEPDRDPIPEYDR